MPNFFVPPPQEKPPIHYQPPVQPYFQRRSGYEAVHPAAEEGSSIIGAPPSSSSAVRVQQIDVSENRRSAAVDPYVYGAEDRRRVKRSAGGIVVVPKGEVTKLPAVEFAGAGKFNRNWGEKNFFSHPMTRLGL
jgi:hypothetical protein